MRGTQSHPKRAFWVCKASWTTWQSPSTLTTRQEMGLSSLGNEAPMACNCMPHGLLEATGSLSAYLNYELWRQVPNVRSRNVLETFPCGILTAVLSRWIWRLLIVECSIPEQLQCLWSRLCTVGWQTQDFITFSSRPPALTESRLPRRALLHGSQWPVHRPCQLAALLSEVERTLVCCPLLNLHLP